MAGIQEARYIQVIWQDKATAKKIVESHDALTLEPVGEYTVEVDIVSFSRIDNGSAGQFAIRLENQSNDVPYFVLENGTSMNMLSVTDPATGLQWWVEGKTWDKSAVRWLSDIYRGAGQVRIQVGSFTCIVNISTSTFSHQQLESYLTDFRADLWELILDDRSYIRAPAKQSHYSLLDSDTLRAIGKFIDSINLVLQQPKVELREVQRQKPRKDVKPVPRTYMELSSRGAPRTLTSRAYQETLDVPENRYAHYMLRKVFQITRALIIVTSNQILSLERNLEGHQRRLEKFSNVKVINRDAVMHDLEDRKEGLRELKSQISKLNDDLAVRACQQSKSVSIEQESNCYPYIRVNSLKVAEKLESTFFARNVQFNPDSPEGEWEEISNGHYVTIDFGIFTDLIKVNFEYVIEGVVSHEKKPRSSSGKTRHHLEVLHVSEIRINPAQKIKKLTEQIETIEHEARKLERQNWQRLMTAEELDQQKREIRSIEKIIFLIKAGHENLVALNLILATKLPALRAALAVFEKAKIKLNARFPHSMAYIQNPAYQGIHSAYLKLKDQAGLNDEEILLAMDKIEEIGLVNISMLYERWCLLQIIKVLMFNYRYSPEDDWKRKLITQVFAKKRNIVLDFKHPSLGRKIRLHYELKLENGNRPDFVLDVEATNRSHEEFTWKKRFVMDAKFYEDINNKRHGGLEQIINELYNHKDYCEGGKNPVFIIHPSPKAAPSRATPQDWSLDDYYGEVRLFDWANSYPNHQYGGIYLSPVENGSYLDSLQRMIGMFLQYGIEDKKISAEKQGALPDASLFCMVCGSAHMSINQSPHNEKVSWATCRECAHFTVYNYCFSCQNRLIKNGEYWSYHAMEPLKPMNIKCPSCASLLSKII